MKWQAEVRGSILQHLMSNRGLEIPITFFSLLRQMRLQNLPLSPHDLRKELEYLSQKQYLAVKRIGDAPGFRESSLRGEQSADHILTIQLTASGVDLVQGAIQDVGVVLF